MIFCITGIFFCSFFSFPGWGGGATGSINLTSALIKGGAIGTPFIALLFWHIFKKQPLNDLKLKESAWVVLPLFLMGIYGLLSSSWSPTPVLSITRAISLIVALSSCCVLSSIYSSMPMGQALALNRNTVFLISGISVTIMVVAGLWGIDGFWRYDGRLGGQVIPTNTLGALSGLVAGIAVIRYMAEEKKWLSIFLSVFAICSLYLCFSRAAFLSLAFSLIFMLFIEKLKYPKNLRQSYLNLALFFFSIGFFIIFLSEYSDFIINLLLRDNSDIENLQTASSRSLLWEKMFEDSGWWLIPGFGYSAISKGGFVRLGYFVTNHAHNGFIQVLLGTGLLGTTFLLWFLSRLITIIKMKSKIPITHWRIIVFTSIFFIINNMSEASIGYQIYPQLIILLILTTPVYQFIHKPSLKTHNK